MNPLSRVETFESDIFSNTCGRSNPDTFESDDVARSGPVSTVVSTAWLQNNMTANENVCAVLVGLRALAKTPNLYQFSFVFEVIYFIHTFSRSSTSSSVQIKQSDFLLSLFVCSSFAVAYCKQ